MEMTSHPPATITEINTVIKEIIESDPLLGHVWITGEITSFKVYQGKVAYMTLSDKESSLQCVMYANALQVLTFDPALGTTVFAVGKVTYFNKKGSLNFQVHYMSTQGTGALSQEFEKLKATLAKEGLFEATRKKKIPKYPQKIGLITAWNSAAMWDFVNISKTLIPHVKLVIIPSTVQGPTAPYAIMQALNATKTIDNLDVLVILRGGGASEDLAWFNQEDIVRAIANTALPTITAIGHDVDITLSDLASDFAAPTPSAAVQFLSNPITLFKATLPTKLQKAGIKLATQLKDISQDVISTLTDGHTIIKNKHLNLTEKITHLLDRAHASSPLLKLRQGYSIATHQKTKKTLKSVTNLSTGDEISIRLFDGQILATVQSVEK